MKRTPVALAAGIACISIAWAVFYLSTDQPQADGKVQALQQKLVESERVIAELRGRELPVAAASSGVPATIQEAGNFERLGSPDAAAVLARLEAIATRIEQRQAQIEKQMKSAHLLPLSRQELDAEFTNAQKTLKELQEHADSQYAEVRRLVIALRVPEQVTRLLPWEAAQDPLYQPYRAYLDAKIKAGYLQKYVNDQAGKILSLQLRCS